MCVHIHTPWLWGEMTVCINPEVPSVPFHQGRLALNFRNSLVFVLHEFVAFMLGGITEFVNDRNNPGLEGCGQKEIFEAWFFREC